MSKGLTVRALRWLGPGFELRGDVVARAGEWITVRGESGAGKTSLLRVLAGLVAPGPALTFAEWRLGDGDFWKLSPRERAIGWVSQEPALFPGLPVWKNAAFGMRVRGVSWRAARARAEEGLAALGLGERADSRVGVLSGGEQARVALVRALAFEPKLVLLDEAFAALDPALRARAHAWVGERARACGAAVISVSHQADAGDGDRVLEISAREGGRVREITGS